jgi:hypothetical protein
MGFISHDSVVNVMLCSHLRPQKWMLLFVIVVVASFFSSCVSNISQLECSSEHHHIIRRKKKKMKCQYVMQMEIREERKKD